MDYEAQLCHGCGGYLPETTDPEGRWSAGAPARCFKCDSVQTKQSRYAEAKNPAALVIWPVDRVVGNTPKQSGQQ